MYPYHNRIKQRIKAGELVGFHFVTDYPRIGEALDIPTEEAGKFFPAFL